MKLKFIILIVVAAMTLITCKKNDPSPATASVGGSGGGGGNPVVSTATVFSGICTTGSFTYGPFTGSYARAYFTNTPQPYPNSSTGISVNAVYYAGDTLNYNSSSSDYSYSGSPNLANNTWSVNGANGITSFSIDVPFSAPSASTFALPGYVSKSSGFTTTISGITNASTAYLIIDDGNSSTSSYIYSLTTGNNTVNVSPANLSVLTPTTSGLMTLYLQNSKAYSVGGKNFQFNKELQFLKTFTLAP